MFNLFRVVFLAAFSGVLLACSSGGNTPRPIDRHSVVARHGVSVTSFDTLSSLTVGNGAFAFTVDATGLQTFPDAYARGVALGTQSDWGWHSYPNTQNYQRHEAYKTYVYEGREVPISIQHKGNDRKALAGDYFRVNPHRLHLGLLGLDMRHADGRVVSMADITDVQQSLDLWTGIIQSRFRVDGSPVSVTTVCHPDADVVSVRIASPLIESGLLSVKLSFGYPTGKHTDMAFDTLVPERHRSALTVVSPTHGRIARSLDSTRYEVDVQSLTPVRFVQTDHHQINVQSASGEVLELSVRYAPELAADALPLHEATLAASKVAWEQFWMSGGAVDFSGSSDPRAAELERRVVLSQYLTRVQCAGIYPPQETGLTFNSWFGKFHLEMDWWHGAHFVLWGRPELLEKRLGWYRSVFDVAKAKGARQGFEGVRWGKMTDPSGGDSPSSIGEMLIWQQPHIIYFAELIYRQRNDSATLACYADLVFATADFMASFARWDETRAQFVLGPNIIPAQECFKPETTLNPPFELAYWAYALNVAISWQQRMGLPVTDKWVKVRDGLAPLASDGDKYLVAESSPDTYTNPAWRRDHPMVLGAFGMMPGSASLDTAMMARTFDHLMNDWDWAHTWGWDYPMTAMCATRLGKPADAIHALLMEVQKNTYLPNGHNYQDTRLRIYLPGNGGILTTMAMMCAGYDGCTSVNPGFPNDGTWTVRWEGLNVMP